MRIRSFQTRWLRSAAFIFVSSVTLFAQKELSIAEIQGPSVESPHVNAQVRVSGIVTAIRANGFYIQTPDDKADKDPNTSEGLYVFGEQSVGQVTIGDLVQVDGTVTEFAPRSEKVFFKITEITRPTVKVVSKGNPLPAPIVLTAKDLDPRGKLTQMEKFEGMRVRGDMVVVAPTQGYTDAKTGKVTSNGVFFVTLQGTPRPFREPGVEIATAFVDKLPQGTPVFDMNPEMLRVESSAQRGAKPIDVPAGATIKGLTGVIDYSRKFYTLVADATPESAIDNVKGFVAVSPATDREVTVAAFNIQNLFDEEKNSGNVENEEITPKEVFAARLAKTSLAIRNVLSSPDVIGVVEVENIKALKKLADKINADAVAAGQPDPKYVPYLEEGNDIRGIDVGFLVKSGKVKVIETKQLAKDVKLEHGTAFSDEKLFDRPPLLLKAEVNDEKLKRVFPFTVIVNHFKSYRGIDDPKDGDRVRNKRRLEAEWLANFVAERVKADPNERIIVCGDLNAFQFNDGYNDLVGILKGASDPRVLTPSKTAHATGLVALIDYIEPRSRYSYTFDGSAQALDHILVNRTLRTLVSKFGYARVDADFPLVWANDATRPERISDHDAPVVFFRLDDPPVVAPTPAATPTPF